MKEIEIIEIPLEQASDLDKMSFALRFERYFIAYETDYTKRHSVLFKDLTWIRKHFGVERNEASPITHDSLNAGRVNEIAQYQKCLDLNVPMWELSYYDDEEIEWKMVEDIDYKYETDRGTKVLKRYNPTKLTSVNVFQERIDLGLLVLCKYV